jgi:UPF0716 protein FxsA
MRKLLLLFVLLPALELAVLIELGSRLGTAPTLLLLALSGLLGAFLARRQGLGALRAAQEQVERGQLPAGPIVDGILILVAGVLLITPGVLTDGLGFLLLLRSFRDRVKSMLLTRFRRGIEERRIRVFSSGFGHSPLDTDIYPIEAEESSRYKFH